MKHKNIVIAPCGNKSFLFQQSWLKQKEQKDFDLCLMFYHEKINDTSLYEDADYFFHLKDFKFHMLYNLLANLQPGWLQEYDYFYFLDDDIEIDTLQINEMFLLSKAMKSDISQASLTQNSFCSWPMFKQNKKTFCRFVGQIEVMSPLFHKDALKQCLPSFIANKSSWGMDSVWPKILGYPENKLIVFDTVVMAHTLPVGGGELYEKLGIDPHIEWEAITKMYGARKENYREYGRLEYINENQNRSRFASIQTNAFINKLKRKVHDYDVMSRVNNKKKILFGKK
jgi:hypothetical protein